MKKKVFACAVVSILIAFQAFACDVNCNQPTAVAKGTRAPIWTVVQCVIGPEGGPYTAIGCKDPKAVHVSPIGTEVVCFIGSDNKVHWDYQWAVTEGNRFKNRLVNGRWQPDWQE